MQCGEGESCSLIGLNAKANGINRDTGCVRYVTGTVRGKFLEEEGVSAEGVEVVIVMDYSLPLDLPIAVIPYLSSAGRQKHTGVMLHQWKCLENISL